MRAAATAAFPEHAGIADDIAVTAATSSEFGDYQCNSAMSLARTLKQSPGNIAAAIMAKLAPNDAVARYEIAGPGFINITLSDQWLAGAMENIFKSEYLGRRPSDSSSTVIMDYSSPNFAKPMHIVHIRS